jgi:hypothetical protein
MSLEFAVDAVLLRVSNDVVQDATGGAVFGLTGMRDRLALGAVAR